MILILVCLLPVVGFREYSQPDREADHRYFYGAVKGVSVSPDEIPRSETLVNNRRFSLERKTPVRVDVYYGSAEARTPEEMLEKTGIIIFPEDHVEFFPDPKLGLGSQITVLRATEVLVNDTGKLLSYRTWSKSIDEFLKEQELDVGANDQLSPGLNEAISRRVTVDIKRAEDSRYIERISLPFQIIVKDDPNLPNGKVRIRQQGEPGERQKIWQVIRRDGKEIKRTFLEDKVVRQPKDRLVFRGTKPVDFQGPYYDWIREAAAKYGADADQMYRVMMCESGGDPYAVSPSGKYLGLYQYDARTWSASGWGDRDRFDAYAQINAAAKAWASRYTKWPVTSRVCGDLGR